MKDLEDRLIGQGSPKFKSEGERRIADFLDRNSIKYQYEPALLIPSANKKLRIWYPDYYLPEFGAYIEYYGLVGRQNYDEGIKRKETLYSKAGVEVIPVYPWIFGGNWQGYIMKELERITLSRYETLMAKTYWSQQPSSTSHNNAPKQTGYHRNFAKSYAHPLK